MRQRLKTVARDILPPLVYRRAKSLAVRSTTVALERSQSEVAAPIEGELKPAEWYDAVYESSPKYSSHYSESIYYPVWTVVTDRVMRSGAPAVLDLGCGPGQFAALLQDAGLSSYCGLDFSSKSIELARQLCPSYEFETADLSQPGVIETRPYDCLVALEFLEHVEDDIGILKRVRTGTTVLATVPNFPTTSHVRHFSNEAEVRGRYEHLFTSFYLNALLLHPRGTTLYLMEGIKR